MKVFFKVLLMMLAVSATAGAQVLPSAGKDVKDLVPDGWTHVEAFGDLNRDGVSDLVLVATPNYRNKKDIEDDEEGGIIPVLAIYFGTRNQGYQCWRQYEDIMPETGFEYISLEVTPEISAKGVLSIGLSTFASMGGWSNYSNTYRFRYQQKDFYLIGKDENSFARNTGVNTYVSENYLTRKKQTVVEQQLESDEIVPNKEKWTSLPKQPLKRLGKFPLEI